MAENNKTEFSKLDLENLQHLSNLLHLFQHRNKNQHRRSIWWRHFSTFRRQLNSLVHEVQSLHEVPTTHLQRTRKKTQDRDTTSNVVHRLEFWRDVLVPKWHSSFSQIVADGRFAVLGLVLIAVLAQTCHIAVIDSGLEESEVVEADKALQNLMEVEAHVAQDVKSSMHDADDLGEVVDRAGMGDEEKKDVEPMRTTTGEAKVKAQRSKSGIAKTTPPRKRRKKGNAIDDLFSGLG